MHKIPIVHVEKCIGCRICELVCSTKDGKGYYNPRKSFVKILRNDEMNVRVPVFSVKCDLCGRCARFCPTKVIEFVDSEQAALIRSNAKIPSIPAPLIGGLLVGGE